MKEQTKALTMAPYRLLLAEDDREMRTFLARVLRQSGYDVVECTDGIAMLTHLAGFLNFKKSPSIQQAIRREAA